MKETIKALAPGGIVVGVVTLAEIEVLLRILLVMITIGYYLWTWHGKWQSKRARRASEEWMRTHTTPPGGALGSGPPYQKRRHREHS